MTISAKQDRERQLRADMVLVPSLDPDPDPDEFPDSLDTHVVEPTAPPAL